MENSARSIDRLMINICSDQLEKSKHFYVTLFNMTINFDSDWFIHLTANNSSLEIGLIDNNHEIVPEGAKGSSAGFYITIVVKDVEEILAIAEQLDVPIVAAPHDTFYGQRRMLLKDPDSNIIDVSSPLPNS